MQTVSLLWGILAIMGMLVGFIPCFGALNWLNIPFAGLGIIVSGIAIGLSEDENKGGSIAGLVCCGIAVLFGLIRLVVGGGVV